jgi:hypothetical protein
MLATAPYKQCFANTSMHHNVAETQNITPKNHVRIVYA